MNEFEEYNPPEAGQPIEGQGASRGAIVAGGYGGERSGALGAPVAGGFGHDAGEGEEEVARLSLGALLRAKWLILGIFFFLSVALLPPIWLLVVPKFSAVVTVQVQPVQRRLVFDVEDDATNRHFASYVNTLIANFTNPTILQRLLEREEVKGTAWYGEEPRTLRTVLGAAPPSLLHRLESAITVENRENTELIDVKVETAEALDAKVIANALVEEFLRFLQETTKATDAQVFEALLAQRDSLEEEITAFEDKIGDLSKELGTEDPDIVRAHLAKQLGELEMERQKRQRDYQMAVWGLETSASTNGADEAGEKGAAGNQPAYVQDREWVRLNNELESARHAYAMAKTRYGEAHPVLQERKADVEHFERLREERAAQLGPVWEGPPEVDLPGGDVGILFLDRHRLQRLVKMGERELELLDAQIAALKREQEAKGELAKQMAQLNGNRKRKQDVYDRVAARIQAIEVERGAPGRISVTGWAMEPTEPARDRRPLYTLAVLLGAMFTGVMVAHLRTTLDPKLHEAGDVQRAMHVPFLGQLPAIPSVRSLAPAHSPLMMECIRIIRTSLLERLVGAGHRVVLITSATSSAGKTTVAVELSRSLASLGKRTLLVEADLRRPMIARRLGMESKDGLAALLTGRVSHKQVVQRTKVPRLDVVLAGERPADFDPELLADGVFAACLARWRKAYDFVLIDSPPILPVADSRILASQVDGAILVSRSSHCRRADVIQACADLYAAGSPLLGTVLVGVRSGAGYGYSYEYSTSDADGPG